MAAARVDYDRHALTYTRLLALETIPTPADCADGFFEAFWNRPEALLDPAVHGHLRERESFEGSLRLVVSES